ncbi:MAG: PAS domain S-box protein, partial [Gammaproteobacteria bacterium]|nr:PAS domain S-box protein [Gammaproteobacteria bacterium]
MQTRKNINKQFLCLFVPVAVVLGLIVGYFYFSEVEKERSGLEANEILHVNLGRQVIEKDLEAAVADLGVLSQHREFDRIDTPRNPEALEHLAQEFLVFVQNKRHYDQIRFLDEAGKEVIRINLGSGHPYIVPEAQLQDKSRRYYFTDAMRLKEGEILVSPLDLNIERGEVERPVKPTIRLVTTVLYGQGKKRGVIVLNYLGSSLMRVLKEVETGIEDHAMILNADGYWLGDPRAEHGLTFKNQFPEAWKRIAKADGGSFYNGKGLFAFATVYPQREVLKLTAGATVADEPIRSEVEGKDKEYHWKVVTHVSSQHIDAATAAVSMKLLLTSASLFGFLAASVWWLAQARVRRMESEERFSLAVRGSNDGIWDWDLKSALIFFSPRWKQMLGYELDDIDNNFMTWRDLVHPDDLGRFLVLWTDYMDGQSESFFIEYRIRRKAGDYAWVLCRGSSLRDEVGHIVRLSGSQTDITERHQADSKLRLQTSALTAADDGIVITDREGNIQWVNRAYTRLTGYGLDEVLGKNPRILKSGKHNQIFYKKMWDTILGGKTWHGELWNKRKDGSLYLEEESITPVLGQGGEVGHFIAIKRDITDRKSIEEELVRFKSTLDKTLDCVFMFEPESLKFFYVN